MIARIGVFRRKPQVLWRPLLGGVMVLESGTAPLKELGGLGALVWLALGEPADADGVLAELRAAGLELSDDASERVVEALARLQDASLVEPA